MCGELGGGTAFARPLNRPEVQLLQRVTDFAEIVKQFNPTLIQAQIKFITF
jgi:hypothetical protein